MKRPLLYILNGQIPVPINQEDPADYLKFSQLIGGNDKSVDQTVSDDICVSTVFLGLDHNFSGKGPPILFETVVFGGEFDQYTKRCATWSEAQYQHNRISNQVFGYLKLVK
jgi:hypothetical protein